MQIKCLGSGSDGNCYLLKNSNNDIIIIDAGLKYDQIIMDSFIPSTKKILGALISHSHRDHDRATKPLERSGIRIYSYETLKPNDVFSIGTYKIMVVPMQHNVYNIGFIIKDELTNKILVYATDTSMIPIIENVDYWLVEANHNKQVVEYLAKKEESSFEHLSNSIKNHFSLEKLVEYFSNDKIKRPNVIICIHLSNSVSNKNEILEKMSAFTNKLYIARKGEIYECS